MVLLFNYSNPIPTATPNPSSDYASKSISTRLTIFLISKLQLINTLYHGKQFSFSLGTCIRLKKYKTLVYSSKEFYKTYIHILINKPLLT